jgi:predicted DNA-binding transcriptional regulator AlpA
MVARILRYPDLEEAGVVSNRATLYRWIRDHGFPPGFLLGPNSRGWLEPDVEQWLSNRSACRDRVSGSRSDG